MGSSVGSISCFSDRDTNRMSLIEQDGLAPEMTTNSDGQKRLNFDTRVLWPKGTETPTFDSSDSEVIVLRANNRPHTERDSQNSLRISVDLVSDWPPKNLRVPQESYDKVPTGRFLEAIMGNTNKPFFTDRMSSRDSAYSTTGRPSYAPFPMTKVLPNLWIGTFDDANNESELKLNGITHILSLVGHQSPFEWVKHKRYPMDDHGKTDLKAVIDEVSDFVEIGQKGNNRLLVHCQSGQNRSAVVIIATLMIMYKKTLYRAHRELKKYRPIVQVNVLYAKQLLQLEQELFNGVNSLPLNWMEMEYDESDGDFLYKYEDMTTSHHEQMQFDSEEK